MNEVEKYVDSIVANLPLSKQEKLEMKEELMNHIEEHITELIESGFSKHEAISHALQAFGDKKVIREEMRKTIFPFYRKLRLLWGLSFLTLIMFLIVFSFIQSMKSDPKEEEKIKKLAQPYLTETFDAPIAIYDAVYDNMGNFNFEYAAKVRHSEDQTEFLVYVNESSEMMENDYVVRKLENELKLEINSYVEKKFIQLEDIWVILDENIGSKFKIDVNNPGSYKDYSVQPHIWLHLNREQSRTDEQSLNEFILFLQDKAEVKHGAVTLSTSDYEDLRKEF